MEIDLKKRLEIRKDQMKAPEVLMTKIRADIMAGWLPRTAQELGDLLKIVHSYGRKVGVYEECKDIMEKTAATAAPEEKPMTMEKVGVQCGGNHMPDSGNLDKKASGDMQCRYCGMKFADARVSDTMSVKESAQAKKDARGSVEKMLGMD